MRANHRNLALFIWELCLIILFSGTVCLTRASSLPANASSILQSSAAMDSADTHYTKGLEFFKAQKYDAAIAAFERAITIDPHYYHAYRKMAEAYHAKKDLERAQQYFAALISTNHQNAAAHYALGFVYYRQGKLEKAVASFQASAKLPVDFGDAYSQINELYKNLNRLPEAEKFMADLVAQQPENAYAHYGLGHFYQLQSQWEKSLASINQALRLNPELMEAYAVKGSIYSQTWRFQESLQVFTDGLAVAKKKNDRVFQSKFLGGIGALQISVMEFTRALANLEEALALARAGDERVEEENWLGKIGTLHLYLGNYSQAVAYLRAALDLVRNGGDKNNEATYLLNLGNVYAYLGNYPSALEHFNQAFKLAQALGNRQIQMAAIGNSGAANSHLGSYTKSLQSYQQAITLARKVNDPNNEALFLQNTGATYGWLGNFAKALEYYEQALQIVKTKRIQGLVLMNMGYAYGRLNRFSEALEKHHQAAELLRKAGDRKNESTNLANLGLIYYRQDRYDEALDYTRQALEISQKITHKFGAGYQLNNLGEIYLKQQNFAAADSAFRAALQLGEESRMPEVVWRAHPGLAAIYERRKQFDEAIKHYDLAVQAIENVRSAISIDEFKALFFQDKIGIYKKLIHLLLRLPANTLARRYQEEAFHYTERAKARALLDILAESKTAIRQGIDDALLAREQEIFRNTAKLQTELQTKALNAERKKRLTDSLNAEDEKWTAYKLELRRRHPNYADLQYPEPLQLAQAQKILDAKELLLEYVLGEEQSYLWVIAKDTSYVCALPAEKEIVKRVEPYLAMLEQPPQTGISSNNMGKNLFDLLIPSAVLKRNGANWIIIPDGVLCYLPFETLISRVENGAPHYLIESCGLGYAPSASVLAQIRKQKVQAKRDGEHELLAFGDPLFGEAENAASTRGSSSPPDSAMAPVDERELYAERGFELRRLPYSAVEVESIAKFFPKAHTAIYLRDEATEERAKAELRQRYQFIHFATHGVIDDTLPGRSSIVLTLDRDLAEDGFLQMNEIFNLSLDAELVALSACQTGRGKFVGGEGFLGLTRAFLFAGAKSLLVSLWPVNDQSTAKLMAAFYGYLRAGKTKAGALQAAKIDFIRSDPATTRHPYYWAPFVLIGN